MGIFIHMDFLYLAGGRLQHHSGHPVSVLKSWSQWKIFPDIQWEHPVLQVVPIASGHHWKQPGFPFSFHPPFMYLHTDKNPSVPSLLWAELFPLSLFFLTGEINKHACVPSLEFLQYVHVSTVLGGSVLNFLCFSNCQVLEQPLAFSGHKIL